MERSFFSLLNGFLQRTLTEKDLTPVEKQYWIQSGLALSPLMATCTQYSIDFCLGWALIGEWTSRILFPVPKGPWPRHGHAGALLPEYQPRSPRIVAWARASFEQGALPSLLFLQGLVPIFSLPGDKMFQSTGICQGKQRPPIMHAYGGAKIGMAQALRSIASEGWIPLAAAMVGTVGKEPMWADFGLRPVVGTTVDIKIAPHPLEHRSWSCYSPVGGGGITVRYQEVPLIHGWLTLTLQLGLIVKTRLTLNEWTLIALKPPGYLKIVALASYQSRTCRINRSWRQLCQLACDCVHWSTLQNS